MSPIPHRMVIYPKDVKNILGCSDSTARRLLARIRDAYNKKKGDYVTIDEFCTHTSLEREHVAKYLALYNYSS